MVEEYESIVRNIVWDVVLRPKNKSVVSSRWLYKVKKAIDGSVEKHKARFVARGFSQVEGIDYDDTFAPITRYSSIRSMLALSAKMGWKIHHMDVKSAFLNGQIKEEQAPRAWYTRIDNYFIELGFTKSEVDANLYHIVVKGKLLIIVLYFDDLILAGHDQLIVSCKEELARELEMKDMGLMHYFLGMEVWQKDGELFLSQRKYANEILKRFHMEKCKPMQTPLAGFLQTQEEEEDMSHVPYASAVGSLMYAMVCAGPDIAHAMGVLSRFISKPGKEHWTIMKRVFRYLRGTSDYGLCYQGRLGLDKVLDIRGFVDGD
eukprot:PITA_34357